MGRRKRKVIRVIKRGLPKVFGCPRCGMFAVNMIKGKENATIIACGQCNLRLEYTSEKKKEFIDVYNEFVDQYMAGKVGV